MRLVRWPGFSQAFQKSRWQRSGTWNPLHAIGSRAGVLRTMAALWGVRVGGVALWLSKAEIGFHTDDAKSGQIAQTSEKDT